jgi:hypothetical protein
VRQGASWTAASHLQLTVAAAARPIPSSVGAPGVLAGERSWLVLAQTKVCPEQRPAGSERSGVVAVVDTASRQATASVTGVQHAVSTHPLSGVRDPAVQPSGVRSPGVVVQRVQRSAVRCPPVQRPAVRCSAVCCPPVRCPTVCCPPVRCPTVCCRPRRSGRVGLLPCSGGGVGDQGRGGRATLTTGTGGGPGAAGPSTARSMVEEAGTRATLRKSRWPVGGRWPTRAAGLGAGRGGRACPLSDQAGQAGVRSAPCGRLMCGHGSGLQREVAAPAAWLASSAGARPRWVVVAEPDARVGVPEGPGGGAGGDGRAAPARPKPAASAPGSLPAAL